MERWTQRDLFKDAIGSRSYKIKQSLFEDDNEEEEYLKEVVL
jgi:hypothetical protein